MKFASFFHYSFVPKHIISTKVAEVEKVCFLSLSWTCIGYVLLSCWSKLPESMYPRLDNKMATLVTGIKEVLHIAVMEVKFIHVMVPIEDVV